MPQTYWHKAKYAKYLHTMAIHIYVFSLNEEQTSYLS